MIRGIYVIFIIAIKDLEFYVSNSNLLLEKRVIWFDPSAQKGDASKYTTDILFYPY